MSEYDEPNNDEYIAPKQLTYYSLFGQYGFDMVFNETEFILIPITSEDQYNAYISKYNLSTIDTTTTMPIKQGNKSTVKKPRIYPLNKKRLDRPSTPTLESPFNKTLKNVIRELEKLRRAGKLDKNTFYGVFKRVGNRELRSNLLSDQHIIFYEKKTLYGGNTRSLKMRKKQTLKRQTKRPRKVTRKQIPRKTVRKTKRKW
jgi:hypothetical protein